MQKKVLLKISGEFLFPAPKSLASSSNDSSPQSIDDVVSKTTNPNPALSPELSELIATIRTLKMHIVACVVGGGNLMRGINVQNHFLSRNAADSIGMLSTVINGMYLSSALNLHHISSKVLSAHAIDGFVEKYGVLKAQELIQQEIMLILAGGLGCNFLSTDTTAVVRALELQCDYVIKLTKVGGIYNSDPHLDPEATRLKQTSYDDVLNNKLAIMDYSSIALARDNRLPIVITDLKSLSGVILYEDYPSIIH